MVREQRGHQANVALLRALGLVSLLRRIKKEHFEMLVLGQLKRKKENFVSR